MQESKVYKDLKAHHKKLFNKETSFQDFFQGYILSYVDDKEILKVINKHKMSTDIHPEYYLQNEAVKTRAIKVLTLMELSDNSEEFLSLNDRIKPDKDLYELDFNKTIKAIVKNK